VDGIDAYLDRLASAEPTPGGGSAATVVGALGAALCAMVARITAGGGRDAAVRERAEAIVSDADVLRDRFAAAGPLDEAAYQRVVDASALPKRSDEEKHARRAALQAALTGAAEAPLVVAGLSAEGMALAQRAAELRNEHLVSDVECALHFFDAAFAASAANVRINHRFLKDEDVVLAQADRLTAIAHAIDEAKKRALASVSGNEA
jgi:formiminotetrahydrofolate cyclodeaminase